MEWKEIIHSLVGGVTLLSTWIGYTSAFRSPFDSKKPVYCKHVISDILDYAPRDVHVVPVNEAVLSIHTTQRQHKVLPVSEPGNIYNACGLFPASSFLKVSGSIPQVLCQTPFTSSKLGICNITTMELCRLMDLPADYYARVDKYFGPHVSRDIPVFSTELNLR